MMFTTPLLKKKEHHDILHCNFSGSCSCDAQNQGDRFIPMRSAINFDVANFSLRREIKDNPSSNLSVTSPNKEAYKRKLAEALLHDSNGKDQKILGFKKRSKTASEIRKNLFSDALFIDDESKVCKPYRHIPESPERVLDAPDLLDDYYLNLLDWSCKDVVAIALGSTAYLWDAKNSFIQELMQSESNNDDDCLTSLAWADDGIHIALGLNNSEIQLWDASQLRLVYKMGGHSSRVGSLAWNNQILSSGSKDNLIINHDVRIRNHIVSKFEGHTQEVCGLKWSESHQKLASGGNDNILHIWDVSLMSSSGGSKYLHRLDQHQAAVKALAWCPYAANILASGGGTADRCIKLWNTQSGQCVMSLDTESQVCALQWNRHYKEVLSSHGYSKNQLCLWKYPSMHKIAELNGHTQRVLHLAQNPDGTTVASAAADETLRFWKVFGNSGTNSSKTGRDGGRSLSSRNNIR
ncbi:cell division cycle 20.2, cofactor of APC complex [Cryptomeria japonica]|uniref:cell division cycle 20.2, cofactor of APC complex n=1 Tax=Cryptomeria japonica TaxID=3369 RepID=UPI0027DA99A3|nr:cell division cycle 20.2, cofactor of APC complex [Cryptomeria japonica]XP_057849528.2 cell division cycle 20.2, cofactor of APC complex [Cryptomeria japonica]